MFRLVGNGFGGRVQMISKKAHVHKLLWRVDCAFVGVLGLGKVCIYSGTFLFSLLSPKNEGD